MKFKHGFIVYTPEKRLSPDYMKHERLRISSEIGQYIGNEFGFKDKKTENGTVYELEIFACPIDKFNSFMKRITGELAGEDALKIMHWIADMG